MEHPRLDVRSLKLLPYPFIWGAGTRLLDMLTREIMDSVSRAWRRQAARAEDLWGWPQPRCQAGVTSRLLTLHPTQCTCSLLPTRVLIATPPFRPGSFVSNLAVTSTLLCGPEALRSHGESLFAAVASLGRHL